MTPRRIICVHATTNRIITSGGNVAAAVRDTQRRATDQMKHLLRSNRSSQYGNKKNNYFGRMSSCSPARGPKPSQYKSLTIFINATANAYNTALDFAFAIASRDH